MLNIIAEYNEVKIPSYALCYLINNDSSGLDIDDIKIIDDYMEQFYNDGFVIIAPCDDDFYFTWSPAFGLACNVLDCTIIVHV